MYTRCSVPARSLKHLYGLLLNSGKEGLTTLQDRLCGLSEVFIFCCSCLCTALFAACKQVKSSVMIVAIQCLAGGTYVQCCSFSAR